MGCDFCGGVLPATSGVGRPRLFCSRTCADAAYRQRQRDLADLGRAVMALTRSRDAGRD